MVVQGQTVQLSQDIRDEGAPAFQVRDLSFFYGKEQVLKGITLDISKRKVTAIMGPSGCGKSTFLRVLNRLY